MRLLEEYDKFVKEAEASAAQPQVSQPEKKSFAERAATITQVNTESVNALWKSSAQTQKIQLDAGFEYLR